MIRPIHLATLALSAATPLSGCAPPVGEPEAAVPASSTARQCFLPRQINGYSEAPDGPNGEERLYINTGARDRWLVEAAGCPELDFSFGIALDSRFNGTRLCSGETAMLIVPRGGGAPDHCQARLIGKAPPR